MPSNTSNGPSPAKVSHEVRDRKERDNLRSAIQSSNKRHILEDDHSHVNPSKYRSTRNGKRRAGYFEEDHARDSRDEADPMTPLAMSRPHSPYTQHPTIDFDGLSWPSKQSAPTSTC